MRATPTRGPGSEPGSGSDPRPSAREMGASRSRHLRDQLTQLAERLGISVRFEPLSPAVDQASSSKGGLCTLRGVRILVVDSRLGVEEQIGVLAESMAAFDLESMYIPPAVRARVRRRNVPVGPLPRPLARARDRR